MRWQHMHFAGVLLPGAPLVNLLEAVQNLDFVGFLLGILIEFMYEMNTARRDLSKNDFFGIYIQIVYFLYLRSMHIQQNSADLGRSSNR